MLKLFIFVRYNFRRFDMRGQRLMLVELFIAILFNLMSKCIQFRQAIDKAIELASSVTCFVAFYASQGKALFWSRQEILSIIVM